MGLSVLLLKRTYKKLLINKNQEVCFFWNSVGVNPVWALNIRLKADLELNPHSQATARIFFF